MVISRTELEPGVRRLGVCIGRDVLAAGRQREARMHAGGLLDHRHGPGQRLRGARHRRCLERSLAEHDQRGDEPGQLQEHHGSDRVHEQLVAPGGGGAGCGSAPPPPKRPRSHPRPARGSQSTEMSPMSPKSAARRTAVIAVLLGVLAAGFVVQSLMATSSPAAPTITAKPSNPSTTTAAAFAFTSAQSVTFRCSLDGGAFSNCAGPGTSGSTSLTVGQGSHTFQVLGKTGSQTSSPASYSWVVDSLSPAVSSITRVGSSPTSAATLQWKVTFTEPVKGVNASDFALQNGGLGGAPAITGVSPAVSAAAGVFTVTASAGSGSGTLGLNLTDDDSIVDAVGNKLGGGGVQERQLHDRTGLRDRPRLAGSAGDHVRPGSLACLDDQHGRQLPLHRRARRVVQLQARRGLVHRLLLAEELLGARPGGAHLPGAANRQSRKPGPCGVESIPDRLGPPADSGDRLQAAQLDQRELGDLLVRRRRGRCDVPLPARRRQLRRLHEPAQLSGAVGGNARVSGEGTRRSRERERRRELVVARRHDGTAGARAVSRPVCLAAAWLAVDDGDLRLRRRLLRCRLVPLRPRCRPVRHLRLGANLFEPRTGAAHLSREGRRRRGKHVGRDGADVLRRHGRSDDAGVLPGAAGSVLDRDLDVRLGLG